MCFWTSTKLILKGFFANGTWNKVVQSPKNKIVKKKSHFEIDIKRLKNILMRKWYSSWYITKCKYTSKPIQTITKLDEIHSHILHMNSLSHFNYIWRVPLIWFIKNIWMRFFIQTSVFTLYDNVVYKWKTWTWSSQLSKFGLMICMWIVCQIKI